MKSQPSFDLLKVSQSNTMFIVYLKIVLFIELF